MSKSVTTPMKSFIPQRTGNMLPSIGYRGILKHGYDSSNNSDSVNILADLTPFPDPYWSLYDEDEYIGRINALDIHIL